MSEFTSQIRAHAAMLDHGCAQDLMLDAAAILDGRDATIEQVRRMVLDGAQTDLRRRIIAIVAPDLCGEGGK